MRGRPGPPYVPVAIRVAQDGPVAHHLMWAHADGAVALMEIGLALARPGRAGAGLRKIAHLLRQAADHVDQATHLCAPAQEPCAVVSMSKPRAPEP